MSPILLFVLASFAQLAAESPGAVQGGAPAGDSIPYVGTIHAKFDNRVYAEADGLLTTLTVSEGIHVAAGQALATIDDRTVQAQVDVATIAFHAADERAKDDIEIRYAQAAAAVARTDYKMGLQANAGGKQVISAIDIEKKKLDWKRATLQIEKAEKDQRLARLEADTKQAELRAAKIALGRRTVVAPFEGEVQFMFRHEDEWVNPGDEILRLIQFDVMWVDSTVSTEDYDPIDVADRPVTVEIKLARGRRVKVPGRIIYVDQEVVGGGEAGQFNVRAEVQNQRDGNFWLVRPGLPATMTIHVGQPPVESAAAQGAGQR